ncbi:MAG: DUF3192 domain-containing protein [Xanthomonadaceae bacterium]|nr:DUF3192 domain-containing protein [Xanthomonadaceae bacterium]
MYGKLLVVLVMSAAVSGCVIVIDGAKEGSSVGWQTRQTLNRSVIPSLALGTSFDEVTRELGEPEFTEAFSTDEGEYRALFYRTHRWKGDGITTREETTPVVFRDGALAGVGDDYYRRLTGG